MTLYAQWIQAVTITYYKTADLNWAAATIYPNFNSNTVWLNGTIVPYENSTVFEGMSL